ncbi:MAG: hypothetical protein L6R43_04950 [Planctomycetes bacterium]|nr:hypothetical protein [Planctomycetota bacterium]
MPGARPRASPAALLALLLAVGGAASLPGPAAASPPEGGPPPPPAPAAAKEEREEDREWFLLRMAVFDPFERRLPRGAPARFRVTMKGPYRSPVLVVVFPDGDARYFAPDARAGRTYDLSFRLDPRGGTHRVALAADGPGGMEYAARFRILGLGPDGKEVDRDIDLPAGDAEWANVDPEESPLRLERYLFHRMNAFRRGQGLPELPWLECVARAAREQLPDLARHYEETVSRRTGLGDLLHFLPGAGPGGAGGPTIADRVRLASGWPLVLYNMPKGPPSRGRGNPNYVAASLTIPTPSLDERFGRYLLRKSDHRVALVNPHLTHAAGAATWRYYGWRGDSGTGPPPDRTAPPGPPPKGRAREVLTALVYVQVNDPRAEESIEREAAEVRSALGNASGPAERAAALRLLGRHALPGAAKALAARAGDRDPLVAAGALDGLWLCDPGAAAAAAAPLEVRVAQGLAGEEESLAAAPLAVLSRIEWDAATLRRATAASEEIGKRARAALGEALRALGPAEAGK